MNPWDFILLVMGWLFAACVFIGAAIFIFAILVGGVQGIRKMFKPSPKNAIRQHLTDATIEGMKRFQDDPFAGTEKLSAFKSGAAWSWDHLHQK